LRRTETKQHPQSCNKLPQMAQDANLEAPN
jgi:hypothetical protein